MPEFLDKISYAIILVLLGLCGKIWSSSDKFFEEKAKNYATKQDIIEITKMTETVQSEFHKVLGRFDADLKFKYQFYENQYSKLYSKLYQKICESEAIRFTEVHLRNQRMDFEEIPIAYYDQDDTGNNNAGNKSIKLEIKNLILEQYMYASPELMKLICTYDTLEMFESSATIEDKLLEMERAFWVNIVETILNDYYWLRQQLHFEDSKEQLELLKRGGFISYK